MRRMTLRRALAAIAVWLLASSPAMAQSKLAGIVTRDGDKLLDGGREYRLSLIHI